ncbi:O-antigen ligase family protein [Patulibacter defluvii]|uniref:O-antigen ligase family protein n=1 Tax=Patulibacter defluvii TaxID=3095358 RepID=UPI002A75FAFE|nr:O-antigen ligase family protein [Patulibacter sp. DM4]
MARALAFAGVRPGLGRGDGRRFPLLLAAAIGLAALALGGLVAYDPMLGLGALAGGGFLLLAFLDLPLGLAVWLAVQSLAAAPGTHGGPTGTTVLVLLCWIARAARDPAAVRRALREARWAVGLTALLLAWTAASLLWAEQLAPARTLLIQYAIAMAFVPVIATSDDRARAVIAIATGYVAGVVVAVLYATALGTVDQPYLPIAGRPGESQGRLWLGNNDPNYLASTIVSALALSGGLLAVTRRRAFRIALVAGLPVLLYGLAATQSRGGIVALLVVAVAAPVLCRGRRLQVTGYLAVGLAVAAMLFVSQPGAFERLSSSDSRGGTGRSDVWHAASRVTAEHPLTGVGVGNFQVVLPRYGDQPGLVTYADFIVSTPLFAVSIWWQALSETGVVGGLLLLAALLACLISAWRAGQRFARARRPDLAFLAQMVLTGQLGAIAASTFLSNANERLFWGLLALGPALLVASRHATRPPASTPTSPADA